MSIFEGSGVALVTPFKSDGSVDFEKYGELLEFHLANGTDAIISCGTTGEASTLTDEEQISVIKYAVEKVNKRVPVIAGTGSNYTSHGIELSVEAEKVGADALLVVTPYYNKTTQKGLIENYEKIADAVNLPIVLYNVPSRTGMNITPKTAYALSKIKNVVAIKEASSNIVQIAEMAELCGDSLDIYSGNDDHVVPILSLGGKGVITTVGNIIPQIMHDMVALYKKGSLKESLDLQLKILGLVRAVFCEVNPIPIKQALNIMGKNVGGYRAPLTTMEEKNIEYLKQEMKAFGLPVC